LPAFPEAVVTNITSIDPEIESGQARQASLEIQRQLGRSLTASVGYLHLTGRHIIMSRNINVPTVSSAEAAAQGLANLGRPDPRVGNNGQFQSAGRSSYNGLTVALNGTHHRWGTARVSYTLSKALDDSGNAFFSSPQDNFNLADDFGRSDNDQRHHLVVSGSIDAPLGFNVAYVFGYSSAPPFNVQTGTDRNHDTNVNDRPPGIGRNTGRGFDGSTLDLRIARSFHVAGPHTLELLVDAFNLLNRTNLLIPNNIFGPGGTPLSGFGQPTAAGDARQLQLGVRWAF
jgi:hypothetical protein